MAKKRRKKATLEWFSVRKEPASNQGKRLLLQLFESSPEAKKWQEDGTFKTRTTKLKIGGEEHKLPKLGVKFSVPVSEEAVKALVDGFLNRPKKRQLISQSKAPPAPPPKTRAKKKPA
ncbi:MAG: hypothetical protein ACFCD0_18300 [Gemmataceae bacterium]